jgi:RimJ/RimL family protein N-acetyltransferase
MESEHLFILPLTEVHIPSLYEAIGSDPEIYRWLPFSTPQNLEEFSKVLEGFIRDSAAGIRVAHAVILKEGDRPIGTTAFLDLNPTHNSIEIGSTFYSKDFWRSFVNTEAKFLMLSEAFEVRGVERVTLKTDSLNQRSRNAIERIGAKFEGILRHHMRRPDGSWRDSAYFSILREEWPDVKQSLLGKLQEAKNK